ncbi:type II toxin-antitoxin system PemK/MazF family toxin [Clostridium sp. 19966]|uniref:type II toxin-antitoxin system PemK/MazF family toxin n=1 Tax=Clostridium sp. 19966 TaxID=2768166 RepID=UPI0028E04190|nr:type II toxin-antitoxin system PemK/MazF family toxin [Clostridium sp. 19966]MDT8716990.1 type II toxin-antitoxin system PemK/MazF family toxin [Clostridium sp. 19966]
MEVKYDDLNIIADDVNQKTVDCKTNIMIRSNMYPFIKKYMEYLETLNSYEVASIFIDVGKWEKSRKKSFDKSTKPFRYNQRDIVFVNLGASNYGFEASYKHPFIVFANGFNWILGIPCSTGRYKVKNEYIIKGERSDGFQEPTGIQLDKIRIIDKWRIEGDIKGRLSATKFKEINEKLIELYFQNIDKKMKRLLKENFDLKNENEKLLEKINEYEKNKKTLE